MRVVKVGIAGLGVVAALGVGNFLLQGSSPQPVSRWGKPGQPGQYGQQLPDNRHSLDFPSKSFPSAPIK